MHQHSELGSHAKEQRPQGQGKGDEQLSEAQEDQLATQMKIWPYSCRVLRKQGIYVVEIDEEEGEEGEREGKHEGDECEEDEEEEDKGDEWGMQKGEED